ncbi:hypothetical protein QL093DRAFT_2318491, partial [Fusarium oxysporum]
MIGNCLLFCVTFPFSTGSVLVTLASSSYQVLGSWFLVTVGNGNQVALPNSNQTVKGSIPLKLCGMNLTIRVFFSHL